ncbi:MAG: NAD(P)-binding protein [archaeon]|nr:NAD(P)-binding protein [archaeon]
MSSGVAMEKRKKTIGVVGGGIAGLSTAWLLSQDPEVSVVLYESLESPGFSNASVPLTDSIDIDVPQRYFVDDYYPTLSRLYRYLGVDSVPVSSPTSFLDMASPEKAYFAYHNLVLFGGKISIPWINPLRLLDSDTRTILLDMWRFQRRCRADFEEGRIDPKATLRHYLSAGGISAVFRDKLLGPLFAVVCTCSVEAALSYPAIVVVEWFLSTSPRSTRFKASHQRVKGGIRRIVPLLLQRVNQVLCGTTVSSIEPITDSDGSSYVMLQENSGDGLVSRRFDAVVLASPPGATLKLLKSPNEIHQRIFGCFQQTTTCVVLHRDEAVMPRDRRQWNSMNFVLSPDGTQCQATLWQNSVQDLPSEEGTIFQTWNPLVTIDPQLVISQSWFERPVLTTATLDNLHCLEQLQGAQNIWYCGSYAHQGIPLLESAVSSGLAVAARIANVSVPFLVPSREEMLAAHRSLLFPACCSLLVLLLALFMFRPIDSTNL